jgi:hypothetical protein
MGEMPPMPQTEAEWSVHWAFYQLTVAQRDRAWREVETLQARLRLRDWLVR